MRLATYTFQAQRPQVGLVTDSRIVPLYELGVANNTSLLELIQSQDLGALADKVNARHTEGLPLEEVRLLAPIPRPLNNVICLGRNYREHAVESARAWREEVGRPTFFTKATTSVTGPYDDIPLDPQVSLKLDWEVELAVVIGRRARHVKREEALNYLAGYMVLNDVSARDLQKEHGGQFFFGKSLDGTCPCGPWLVTADELPDPGNINLRLRINGQQKQEGNTRDLIFDIPEIIQTLSGAMTLEPGQIIATGTPAGVGHARQPPEFLRNGDVVESEIEGIGVLRNRVATVVEGNRC